MGTMGVTGESGIRVRAVGDDELAAYLATTEVGFGELVEPAVVEEERTVLPVDRTVAAFEGDEIVGTASSFPFELTVPGGAAVPVAGVTGVGVLPTHRRRGILRAMMAAQLDDVARRGEVAAVLIASEGAIYRRFGYGVANEQQVVEVDAARFALDPGPLAVPLRLVDRHRALDVLPPIYEAWRRRRPGSLSRSPAWWALMCSPIERWRGGGKQFFVVAEPGPGHDGGYATYRMEERAGDEFRFRAKVRELVATDPEVEAALWRYCASIDLVEQVEVGGRPLDDAVPWRLADPRAVRVARHRDQLWLRLLDVPAALAARAYDADGDLVVEVGDRDRPDLSDRYRLVVVDGVATCERTGAPADLALDVADLGSLYLGGVAARVLGRAGRIEEHRSGALARADALFASSLAPVSTTFF